MPKLILIKHASPTVDPTVPPEKWKLSDRGRESCAALSERLRAHVPQIIVSSAEIKAIETAQLIGNALGVSACEGRDLHEHDRSNVPHMRSGEFISMIELFFRKRSELVMGRETAAQAEARFAGAVADVIEEHDGKDVAIVSHGTVISLFLARHGERNAFALWRELGLPSFVVMELPSYRIVEVVARI